MKTALLCDGRVLVVGDGDFSFTVALMKQSDLTPDQVFTSNLESEASILRHAQASENMTGLKDLGVTVFLETDARDLHNHPTISKERFDRIIFNFPLSDRHNIKKNRSLLADFFLSCRSVLTANGRILVTLCKGQGGTPADQPVRSWHDSWQIVAMATNAGFLLREILPFDPSDFPEYHSVGFRFQDKSFNVTGALTHVFEEGTLVEDTDCSTRGTVLLDGKSYSCSSYVASILNRQLLEESRNPLTIVRKTLEERLKTCQSMKNLVIENGCSSIIPSHKSTAYLCSMNELEDDIDMDVNEATKEDKDWKNCENMKRMNQAQLAHGVAGKGDDNDATHCSFTSSNLLPVKRENVYILVKTKVTPPEQSCNDRSQGDGMGSESVEENVTGCADSRHVLEGDASVEGSIEGFVSGDSQEAVAANMDSSSLVYHCRTSLLEDMPYLCSILNNKQVVMNSQANASPVSKNEDMSMKVDGSQHGKASTDLENSSAVPGDCPNYQKGIQDSYRHPSTSSTAPTTSHPSAYQHDGPDSFREGSSYNSFPCLMSSGQCMLPCPITPSTTPAKHETLILHQISPIAHLSRGDARNLNQCHFDFITSKMLSLLQSLNSQSSHSDLFSMKLNKSVTVTKINVNEIDELQLVGHLIPDKDKDYVSQRSSQCSQSIGSILYSRIGECFYHVTIINLEHLVCGLCDIGDPRLLWSVSEKFLSQFEVNISLCRYRPFSLYPMKFVHDLSFWEKEISSDSEPFDESGLYEAIRNIAGDLVINVSLIDIYKEPDSNRRSRCYRLYFLSLDKCLPYVISWKLQSRIRMEVARSLCVELR